MGIGDIWNLIGLQPMINSLIVLTNALFGNFGLAIIVLTLVVNGLIFPLTIKQVRASKAMQDLQPMIAELQKKYGKDKDKMAREQMKLFKEAGVSPAGCLLPLLVQMPIWFALFQSIMRVLAVIPENLVGLSDFLYSWPVVYSALPLNNHFLWLNLATGDIFLALLVGGTMWVQQKMVQTPVTDPSKQSQSALMLWMMPIMFAWLTTTFPSGLAIFWVTSNIFRIGTQYFVGGWGGLFKQEAKKPAGRDRKYKERITQVEQSPEGGADIVVPTTTQEEGLSYEESGGKRPDGRSGYPKSLRATRRQPRKGRGHRRKRG